MLNYAVAFFAGLIVGWNVLPQPTWVKVAYDSVLFKLKNLFTKKN